MKTNHGILHTLLWIPSLIICLAVVQIVVWAADREPPFVVLDGGVVPPANVGGILKIKGDIRRDITRGCSLTVSHWIEDRVGFRSYLPVVEMSAESIAKLEQIAPGTTKFSNMIPYSVATGSAIYHAENRYVCNPTHVIWPIVVVTRLPFEVLP